MNKKLKDTLYKAMQKWMDENCEQGYWPSIYVGNKTSDLMAKAAASVFDAVEEFQEFAVKEGYMENT